MSILMEIHNINPADSFGLKNRPDPGKKKTPGRLSLSRNKTRFEDLLEDQLKEIDFAIPFQKAGESLTFTGKRYSSIRKPQNSDPFSFLKDGFSHDNLISLFQHQLI